MYKIYEKYARPYTESVEEDKRRLREWATWEAVRTVAFNYASYPHILQPVCCSMFGSMDRTLRGSISDEDWALISDEVKIVLLWEWRRRRREQDFWDNMKLVDIKKEPKKPARKRSRKND